MLSIEELMPREKMEASPRQGAMAPLLHGLAAWRREFFLLDPAEPGSTTWIKDAAAFCATV